MSRFIKTFHLYDEREPDQDYMYSSCLIFYETGEEWASFIESTGTVNIIYRVFLFQVKAKTKKSGIRWKNSVVGSGSRRLGPDPDPRLLNLTYFYPFLSLTCIWDHHTGHAFLQQQKNKAKIKFVFPLWQLVQSCLRSAQCTRCDGPQKNWCYKEVEVCAKKESANIGSSETRTAIWHKERPNGNSNRVST
jgi:hypothetical protein